MAIDARRVGALAILAVAAAGPARGEGGPARVGGRYPHLAMFNHQGECGTGAVVPWAGRLWVVTYAPHMPGGSDDKLYEIDEGLRRVIRPESVGGTPADRLIHRESNQLVIGPYFIDARGAVRAIPPRAMPGRLSAAARHLTDPAGKVYVCDMEGMIYEVDVRSLAVHRLFVRAVPGWHCKGGYTAQGRLVVANNGEREAGSVVDVKGPGYLAGADSKGPEEAGVLAEWDGRDWRVVERRQFTEVTGPGGIEGSPSADSPLWSVGWDARSAILKLLDGGKWSTFRLPKADHSYDGRHGWHTEWPRIREVAPGKLLMSMHGGWFDFPKGFSAAHAGGIRPIADHLKVTADFCGWKGEVVFGCDDAAKSGFLTTPAQDPMNSLIGQSQSNLWFSTWDGLARAGRPAGQGGPWVRDAVKAGEPSSPYLLAGYSGRVLHLAHDVDGPVGFSIEVAVDELGRWARHARVEVPARGYGYHLLPDDLAGEWVRVVADRDCPAATAYFHYGPGGGAVVDRAEFAALADVDAPGPWIAGVGRPEGDDRGTLALMTRAVPPAGPASGPRYHRLGPDLKFSPLDPADPEAKFLAAKATTTGPAVEVDAASVILAEGKSRFRLPKADPAYDRAWAGGWPRGIREVVTERSLLNAHGTFYVLPRATSGGVARIKPVCTHGKRITDFFSWRGLMALVGTRPDAQPDGHYVAAEGGAGLWLGDVDDLWRLGKPRGHGGPWLRSEARPGRPSDPYLMTGYDRKSLELAHDLDGPVRFAIEVDFLADGTWHPFREVEVPPGRPVGYEFPPGYSAHWVRFRVDRDCRASAQLTYE